MPSTNNQITPELYKAIVAIVDERMKELHISREDFRELKDIVKVHIIRAIIIYLSAIETRK